MLLWADLSVCGFSLWADCLYLCFEVSGPDWFLCFLSFVVFDVIWFGFAGFAGFVLLWGCAIGLWV